MFATTGSKDTTHKFTGQILDDNTNLYYYNARYYDPTLCMFITADTIVKDLYDPQSLNPYSYCRNNPIIYRDENGHFFFLVPILVGALVGGTIQGAIAGSHGHIENLINGQFDWGAAGTGFAIGAVGGAAAGAAALVAPAIAGALGLGGVAADATAGAIIGMAGSGASYSEAVNLGVTQWNSGSFATSLAYGAAGGFIFGGLASGHLGAWLKGKETFNGGIPQPELNVAPTITNTPTKTIKDLDYTFHGMKRTIERQMNPEAQIDALTNPTQPPTYSIDQYGRISTTFIGKNAVVIINEVGQIITTYPLNEYGMIK